MSYYGAGDYYGAGGFGSFLKGALKTGISLVTGGPLAAASTAISQIAGTGGPGQVMRTMPAPVVKVPGVMGTLQRIVPGGATGYQVDAFGNVHRRRRKMNYANGRALTRANRRVDGFVKLAKRSLKHTNYKIVTKGSGKSRPRGHNTFIETGPGGIRA